MSKVCAMCYDKHFIKRKADGLVVACPVCTSLATKPRLFPFKYTLTFEGDMLTGAEEAGSHSLLTSLLQLQYPGHTKLKLEQDNKQSILINRYVSSVQ